SAIISRSIPSETSPAIHAFYEYQGKGIEGTMDDHNIRIGSAQFTGAKNVNDPGSRVFVNIDNEVRGYFSINTSLRPGIAAMVRRLGSKCVGLLSVDNDSGHQQVAEIFPHTASLHFNQSPGEKMNFIRTIQEKGNRVMMVGDGLNDAGALKQSDVGIAVTDSTGVFTPAS